MGFALRRLFVVLVFLGCGPIGALSAQGEPQLKRTVEVSLRDGHVDVAELGRALFEAYELDAGAVPIPEFRIDLRGTRGRLVLFAVRKGLFDTVRFRRGDEILRVTIDRERSRDVRRKLRSRLVDLLGGLTGEDLLARSYELRLPDGYDRTRPLVVLVHGLESDAGVWSDLRGHLAAEAEPPQVATFGYPNDEAVERVAARLARELRQLRALGGEPRVAIVAHSMGGLVARAVVEDPRLDPGNVAMLIMIGTPNAGSKLAGLRFALEAAHLVRGADGVESFGDALFAGARANLLDGLGEAGGDLLPGSVFLIELGRRARNLRVDYHLVLGSRSVLGEAQVAALRERGLALLDGFAGGEILRPRAVRWLSELDELVDGRGDGAVSLARGSLAGVEPVVVPLDHVALIRFDGIISRSTAPHPVFARVTEWLNQLR